MQEGIGRGGYRLIATIFLFLGGLGLGTMLYAWSSHITFFVWLSGAFNVVAIGVLYFLVQMLLRNPRAASAPEPRMMTVTPARPTLDEMDFSPVGAGQDDELEAQDMTDDDGPRVPARPWTPPPRPPMPPPVAKPNRNLDRDTGNWPRRVPPSGLTRGELLEMNRPQANPEESAESEDEIVFTSVPMSSARTAPAARPRATSMQVRKHEVPVVIARIAGPDDTMAWVPKDMGRGKCSGCGSIVLAPKARPIRLRCPKCEKLTLLE